MTAVLGSHSDNDFARSRSYTFVKDRHESLHEMPEFDVVEVDES